MAESQKFQDYSNLDPMLSYAQQGEDVVLRRGLADVKNGFYVDLGAGSPDSDSVTRHFYENGWSGINVEPQPHLHRLLKEKRQRDVNLQIAIGAAAGKTTLTIYPEKWGWATTDNSVKETHQSSPLKTEEIEVDVLPINEVLQNHANGKEIDFLKIDIEGAEKEALESIDLKKWQPKIVVVEATRPGSPETNYDEWEKILLYAGYNRTLFDGLNCFYAKDPAIIERIKTPVNTFDKAIPFRYWRLLPQEARQELKAEQNLGDEFSTEPDLLQGKGTVNWV